jgi:hypothetical protein
MIQVNWFAPPFPSYAAVAGGRKVKVSAETVAGKANKMPAAKIKMSFLN